MKHCLLVLALCTIVSATQTAELKQAEQKSLIENLIKKLDDVDRNLGNLQATSDDGLSLKEVSMKILQEDEYKQQLRKLRTTLEALLSEELIPSNPQHNQPESMRKTSQI